MLEALGGFLAGIAVTILTEHSWHWRDHDESKSWRSFGAAIERKDRR